MAGGGWTVFRIPLDPGALPAARLFDRFETWSDGSLVFLRHLKRLEVLGGAGRSVIGELVDTRVTPNSGWRRHHNAVGTAMPVGVGLPLDAAATGSAHGGLPAAGRPGPG
ncbi:hypothetical protein BFF78_07455 [Streptomyces fodineus]|uniref:Uncharacterized protein n=1 Tax=Streptomyces fodineus TaxID=1904616 RepID=A0A1D7Y5L8_9ACTN|nr:hypothetical protein BFF78_07455 [Streptomyces fodineus]